MILKKTKTNYPDVFPPVSQTNNLNEYLRNSEIRIYYFCQLIKNK
jgi:hypothetical protein